MPSADSHLSFSYLLFPVPLKYSCYALMMGIQRYPDIMLDAEEYHVTQEVNAIYETMLNILNDKYQVSHFPAYPVLAVFPDFPGFRRLPPCRPVHYPVYPPYPQRNPVLREEHPSMSGLPHTDS